jgi:uncharacterized protein (TIGR03437 family)
MCRSWLQLRVLRAATIYCVAAAVMLPVAARAQSARSTISADWRAVGNQILEAAVPVGLASGPVERVWFSADGARLFAQLDNGQVLENADDDSWQVAKGAGVAPPASVRAKNLQAKNWAALTGYRGQSIIGGAPVDAAISPVDGDDFVVANGQGLWRTRDGGESWTGLNAGLPNFPGRRILGIPGGTPGAGVTVLLLDGTSEARWQTGEKQAWRAGSSAAGLRDNAILAALQTVLGERPARAVVEGSWVYAGFKGALAVSADTARTWRRIPLPNAEPGAQVSSIFVVPGNPQIALAALNGAAGTRVVRTMNGGIFWDDVTANLPAGAVNGVMADLESGSIYAASDAGLFLMTADLRAASPAGSWTRIETARNEAGAPVPVLDVALGVEGHQVWILLDRLGLRRTLAPHRLRVPKLVSASGVAAAAAAPGGLVSVVGARVARARTGTVEVPVLAAADGESQLQLPFTLEGSSLTLSLEGSASGNFAMGLRATAPAILTDGEGAPLLMDADRGAFIDTAAPARPGTTVQILAAGLGKVTPDWPAGTPAPTEGTPKVVAKMRAWLDRVPVEVTRATLAPGYAGLYLVEIEVPMLVNVGPNELYLETGEATSNRVMLHVGR